MFNWFRKKKKETPQNAVIPAEDRGLTVSCTALSADLKIDDKQLIRFCEKYGKIYPKLVERLSDVTSFFSFYDFPESIRPSIYTTNLIENFNKQIKSQCKKKVQFPNEASLERFICGIVLEYNRESEERIHKGFALAQAQLTDLFI